MDELLPVVMEVGEKNLKCMALLDKANTESCGGDTVMTSFGHGTVLGVVDKVIDAVKAGAIKHFFLVGSCDGARPATTTRNL